MKEILKDKILGSLMGGAAGDALGYSVEFSTAALIRRKYGAAGITRYDLNAQGLAEVSDDTQMTLFTANGLLNAKVSKGVEAKPTDYLSAISDAYIDWYYTQFPDVFGQIHHNCWLWEEPALHHLRAPGNTCITALRALCSGNVVRNDSKGCGGIMRVAPVALFAAVHRDEWSGAQVAWLAGEAARLTHLHALGYLPAALFAYMIYELLEVEHPTREEVELAIRHGEAVLREVYGEYAAPIDQLMELMDQAVALSHSHCSDAEALALLGEGWVAEETLAVAVYALLKYMDDFEKVLVVAVNHDGDSDSTGAVAGNLIGALIGAKAIPACYTENLEMLSVIKEIGEDIYHSSLDGADANDGNWKKKYGM